MSTILQRGCFFLLSILIAISVVPAPRAAAQLTASETNLLPNAPLLITSYQTNAAYNDVRFIELYNSGDDLVDLASWKVYDVANARYLQVSTTYAGYQRPSTHIVLSRSGEVLDASYHIDGCVTTASTPTTPKTLTTLQLLHEGYRSADLALKANGVQQIRNFGSSYLTTFTEGAGRSLFDDGLYDAPVSPVGIEISEVYPYASDCSPLDMSVLCGDYIELHNTSEQSIDLADLVVRTDSNSSSRTSSNTFSLDGILLPDGYTLINLSDGGARISLTNSGGYIWLEDVWSLINYPAYMTQWPSASSDEQGLAYIRTGAGTWQWTTTPTPGMMNVLTAPIVEATLCPEGKYLNPDTGRCRTIEEAVSALASCEEGYERNLSTNRCRKITSATTTSALTPCLEGQERNPATNRCRSIATAVAELLPCDEGYERNPATNRCRKVQSTAIPAAPFAPAAVATEVPVWQWWMGGVIGAALIGYAVWEWRRELARVWQRVVKK